jgi:group II intron reverse transcriptase/maturase
MRDAETVLNIIRERGKKGLPIEDVYRQLYNPDLYLTAYGKIYKNDGAMTEGSTEETVDGMSRKKIDAIIEDIRHERYRWTPVRRTYIPKKDGKKRPLGLPTWSDKLLQEVMRSFLEAYYEPQFSDLSHGFRPSRGCHTALSTIERTWKGTKWFIEGDIKGCFDNIDHSVLLDTLRENVKDNRFIRLIGNLLSAGYMEDWKYGETFSGTPQGGIISPILSNIYLHKLDEFVEMVLIPKYTRGKTRAKNPAYKLVTQRLARSRKKGTPDESKALAKQQKQLPVRLPDDPDYRRLRYIRYADDFILGFAGPKSEAEAIREELRAFLRDNLKLELSQDKTLITHAATESARFLGYEITCRQNDTYLCRTTTRYPHGVRSVNTKPALRIPVNVVEGKCALFMKDGKATHRAALLNDSDYDIVTRFQQEFRGIVNYYLLAGNVSWLYRLYWVMEGSLLKTLAYKHKTSLMRMSTKYKTTVKTEHGPRKAIVVTVPRNGKPPLVAQFGGIALLKSDKAITADNNRRPFVRKRTELLKRLLADRCEICGSVENIQVHHIRKLADLNVKGRREKPLWKQIMSARRRKTLVVCRPCHVDIHAGRPLQRKSE